MVSRDASVMHLIEFARPYLERDDVTEICVNRPGEVFTEAHSEWQRHDAPDLRFRDLMSLATAVARYSNDDVSDTRPILSAILPACERIQIVRPPACEEGTVSVTIRKPTHDILTLDDYTRAGFFGQLSETPAALSPDAAKLLELKQGGRYADFLRHAVQSEQNIVIAGETGSGKTTLMKALMQEIPTDQRIITIEDVPELELPSHPNRVHLFYRSEDRETAGAKVTATTLLRSCMRMKPTRIMLAELRGSETYDFLSVAASGHAGSITSCHAGSCALAFERLALMVLQSKQGQSLPYEAIRRLLALVVDVVVHVHNDVAGGTGRHISDIWYRPAGVNQVDAA